MPSSNKVRKVTSENYPTDAGREGELIFRLVYQQAGCKKPFSRLWLSSMEDSAIRKGFANLKPSTEYDALYNAALCRECADWMVGINATRLFSCLYTPRRHLLRIVRICAKAQMLIHSAVPPLPHKIIFDAFPGTPLCEIAVLQTAR